MLPSLLLLMAAAAAPQTFDLNAASPLRQQAYQPGGHGMEPGSTASDYLFSVALPEGNYRVTVRLGDARAAGNTTVKTEARRLMLRDVATRKGQFVERSFLVNIRTPALPPPPANAPGGQQVRLTLRDSQEYTWDDKLTLEFLGKPQVTSVTIAPVEAPTLYLAGDSTVTDQFAEPAASWGQMLPALLDDKVAVANHAKSGATLKSFLTDLRFDKLLSGMKAGDWLLIQFGHNDQKKEWPQTYVDADVTYPAYLRTYIAEARRRGAHPVLVTSPERRNFDAQGRIKDTLGSYAAAVRKVAAEEGVPLIDLNADSRTIYEALGPEIAPTAFNDGGADKTHHNNYGAWLLASAVAERIRTQIPELAPHVTMPAFAPAKPPAASAVTIVPSLIHSDQRPAGS
ncbi:rhamnogalacturonan acetylesterase [Sphingobium lactosutens]|uniref:rhamnogalacturonan acetylesterase n=1 Tax=Sphingobium lactosutens TaxID=522773 RepID=UPI0015BB500A|nr:rhamnogalacturonan acetylesterase [Sphingobium lactosutens]NWK97699.1 rhamnogalacturonan acetylesterase [Sphingobium lactosutens]